QSSRRNARLILQYWDRSLPDIERHLYVPPVMVFAGHMIDRPGREMPRFPSEAESFVASKIIDEIERIKPGFGFSSAACGSDILFLESMLNYGAEVSVVLPYNRQQFVSDSVDIVPGSNWRKRFDQVLRRAARVITASTERLEIGGVSYEFCNEMLLGLASIRCRQLDTDLVPFAVWNGQTGDGPSGTASVVQSWKSLGLDPVIIDLPSKGGGPSSPSYPTSDNIASSTAFTARVVSILFADAVGFSKLAESEVPRFVEHFLGAIAALSANYAKTILARNTWGDGLYFVFSDIVAAGEFGLELAKLIAGIDWR